MAILNDRDGESIGAVVANLDGGERILTCLASIYRQAPRPSRVLVVDSGSTDGSVERIRNAFPDAGILELTENRGPGAARNAGLESLDTDLALLIDHDLYLAEGCLASLVGAQRRLGATVVCPRICLLPESHIIQADGGELHFLGTLALRHGSMRVDAAPSETTGIGAVLGGCMLVARADVVAAGGFDGIMFFYFEDLEFSLRLRGLGHDFACVPAGVALHDRRLGTPGLAFRGQGRYPVRRAYLTCRNRPFSMLVHFRLRTLVVLAPVLLVYELATVCFAISRRSLAAWARAWWWVFRKRAAIAQRRRRVQAARSVRDRDLLVGGPIPLAPGLARSDVAESAIALLSAALNAYWRFAHRWVH